MNSQHFVSGALILGAAAFALPAAAEEKSDPAPTIQDFSFLVGEWQIEFDYFDAHQPQRGRTGGGTGRQVCEYDLNQNKEQQFIACRGEITSESGSVRTFAEYYRYNRFQKRFERTSIFSNWPFDGVAVLEFDKDAGSLSAQGEFTVARGLTERIFAEYQFNDDFTAYTLNGVENYSDMPITEFNPSIKGRAQKVR